MPTYSYQCKNCSHIVEAFQKMNDAPLKECSNCSKETLERVLLSAPSFKLKGGGWYKTDYAKDKATSNTDTKSADKETPSTSTSSQASSGDIKQEFVKHE